MKFYLLLFSLFFLIVKYLITEFWTPSFYDTNEDYITHAFAHGINVDLWLRDGRERYVNALQYLHPGLPFQITSWLTYVSVNFSLTPIESIMFTLQNPSSLWKVNQYIVCLITIAFIFLSIHLFEVRSKLDAGIFILLFFLLENSLTFSFFHLGNETFAIPIFTLIAWFAKRAFSKNEYANFFMLGMCVGLGYLNKLNYIGWAFALYGTLLFAIIRKPKRINIEKFVLRFFPVSISFVGVIYISSRLMLGESGLRDMLSAHKSVFLNSGPYGSGQAGILNLDSFVSNIKEFIFSEWKYSIIVIALVLTSILRMAKDFKNSKIFSNYSVFLILSFGFIFLIVMKQYALHYLIPAIVVLPFIFLDVSQSLPLGFKRALFIFICLSVILNFYNVLSYKTNIYYQDSYSGKDYISEYDEELDFIRNLPLPSGERRMWFYRIKSFEYGSRMVINWSGTLSLHKYFDKVLPNDMIDLEPSKEILPFYLIYQKGYDKLSKDYLNKYEIAHDGRRLRVYRRI
jgi:hypothetical protein